MTSKTLIQALAAATFLLAVQPAEAQFTIRGTKSRDPIQIDGVLSEAAWTNAAKVEIGIQFEPQRGQPAQERTEAYVLYDNKRVYFAFRSFDSQPEKIAAQLTQRDSDLLDDDAVVVVLDTFNDKRSAYYFMTNALGTQADGRISENGKVVESAWDAPWLAAASRTENGWTAEIAIPFASLRFASGTGQTWGLNLGRTCRRLLETSFWAGPLEERFRIAQAGALTNLDLEAAEQKYAVIPYMIGQFQRNQRDYAVGVDLRYALTPDNILNLTVNPDFATIEADQEEVNLTRFELGLQEKRQFFLEGAEQYRQRIQTFYSRRIAGIRAGAKVLGRRQGWQYSLLSAQSDPLPVSATKRAAANYTAARLQKDILKSSVLALMVTNRNLGRTDRGAMGLDTTLYFTKTFGFTGQLVRSHGPERGGNWAWFARPSRDTSTSHVHFRYTHMGERFGDHVNAIGFIRDDDRREMDSAIEKRFWPRNNAVERIAYGSNYNIYWSQRNVLRSWQVDESMSIDFRNRWSTGASHTSEYKLFERKFRNHRTGFDAGYNTRQYQSASISFQAGHNFDSDFRLLGAQLRRKAGNTLSLEYRLSRLWLDPDPGNGSTAIHAIHLTQNFTRDLFLKVFFQTNSAIDRKNLQAVFVWRYKPPFGTVQVAFQRGTAAFGERSAQPNTLFLKLSYVF